MAGRCAVCQVDLRPQEQFALVGEYVVHRHCMGGIPKPKSDLEWARSDLDKAKTELAGAANRSRLAATILDRAENAERLMRMANDSLQRELATLRSEVAAERSRRIALELQLELVQSQVARPPSSAPDRTGSDAEPISPDKEQHEDDAALRFKLLELQ